MKPAANRLIRLADRLDAVSDKTGRAVSWLVAALVLLVCYDVAMRYVFRAGSVALQELEWHLFALVFLLAAAYTLKHNEHVRVDIVYQRLHPRVRAWIDVFGAVVFLLPFAALVIYSSWSFVADAFVYNESSSDPGGLPYRFILKAAIPLGFALLALQGIASILRNVAFLRSKRRRVRRR